MRDELVLGAYRDGYWMVSSDALDDPTEQIVVSLHERLHHELQYTTPWGVMTEMLSLVANRDPSRAGAFRRVAGFGKNASRTVHEVYATTHSVGARARHVAWLESNEAHRPFYDLGVRLSLGDLEASRFLFDALVRCAMSPAGLANVDAGGLDDVSLRTLDGAAPRPDDGLVRILDLELSALADVKPSGRSVPALASYHDDVAQILQSQGFAVLTSDGSREVVMSIVASVAAIDPELADLIELDSEREPTADDVEASRAAEGMPTSEASSAAVGVTSSHPSTTGTGALSARSALSYRLNASRGSHSEWAGRTFQYRTRPLCGLPSGSIRRSIGSPP